MGKPTRAGLVATRPLQRLLPLPQTQPSRSETIRYSCKGSLYVHARVC